MTSWIGVDPGKTGAVAFPDEHLVFDMPVGPAAFVDLVESLCTGRDPALVSFCVERQQGFPGQGVATTFTTGEGYGIIQGVLAASGFPYRIVSASVWKKAMGVTADKDQARSKARELFPWAELSRVKDHGRAEALLLAEWARRFG